MTNFNYKKYSLENLENWIDDAMSVDGTTPQEIYDVIVGVVKENYYLHKHKASQAYELLALLNGNGEEHLEWYNNDKSAECKKSWNDFFEKSCSPEEKSKTYDDMVSEGYEMTADGFWIKEEKNESINKKWILPVELDGLSGECYVLLPDDFLELANLKAGDQVNWIEREDGCFEMRKDTKSLNSDEC